jgi:hypothetical protein
MECSDVLKTARFQKNLRLVCLVGLVPIP